MACSASNAVAPAWVLEIHLCAVCADVMFESIDSFHIPRRVKMCDGMCCACGAEGAILA